MSSLKLGQPWSRLTFERAPEPEVLLARHLQPDQTTSACFLPRTGKAMQQNCRCATDTRHQSSKRTLRRHPQTQTAPVYQPDPHWPQSNARTTSGLQNQPAEPILRQQTRPNPAKPDLAPRTGGQGQCEGRQAQRGPCCPAGAPCRAHRQGLPKVWAEICSQPNQSAISGSFFGTN